MMRRNRVVFPGCPHHIVQRGYRKQGVFCDDQDRLEFVDRMGTAARSAGLHIWAYALMRNHVHLIAVPDESESLHLAMTRCLSGYAQAFDARHGCHGTLWNERFYASVLALRYLWDGVRYVERNPVRAEIVTYAEDYRWSSAAYHCGLRDQDPLVSPSTPLKGALADWSAWLRAPDLDGRLANLRRKRLSEDRDAHERVGLFDLALDRRIFSCGPKRK